MGTSRLEAFSDAVIAIIMTIMVLELRIPESVGREALRPLLPVLSTYALSFVFLGIYWTNHHHLLHATDRINGKVLWANLHLLFWLSLVPFVTGWMGENEFAALPVAVYGVVMLLSAIAWWILRALIVGLPGFNQTVAAAVGRDTKGVISVGLYLSAIPLAFVYRWISLGIYLLVVLMWCVPDRRIESKLQ